jgi:hypothetical protein
MPYDRSKFKTLVHYVCSRVEDPTRLGAVKLNKVLWFSDVLTYLNFNAPVTGARYVKRQFGPVPAAIVPIIEELKIEGALAVRNVEYFGKPKREFFALTVPDISAFSADEISVVESVIDLICERHTATSISEFTHDDAWEMAQIGEDLPFYTVFAARRGEVDESDMVWAEGQIAELRAA